MKEHENLLKNIIVNIILFKCTIDCLFDPENIRYGIQLAQIFFTLLLFYYE